MTTSDSVLIVSADCHAGAPIQGYRQYLESKWHDEFDAWAASFTNPFSALDEIYANRNWDSQLRLRQLEQDGIAADPAGAELIGEDVFVKIRPGIVGRCHCQIGDRHKDRIRKSF